MSNEIISKFPKTWIAKVDQIEKCFICGREIPNDFFGYYCNEDKVFFCEDCIDKHGELPSKTKDHKDTYCLLRVD